MHSAEPGRVWLAGNMLATFADTPCPSSSFRCLNPNTMPVGDLSSAYGWKNASCTFYVEKKARTFLHPSQRSLHLKVTGPHIRPSLLKQTTYPTDDHLPGMLYSTREKALVRKCFPFGVIHSLGNRTHLCRGTRRDVDRRVVRSRRGLGRI